MTKAFALEFAKDWIDSWNSHNLNKIMEHYSEDFTIESPMALRIMPDSKGFIAGKENVRAYWKTGLEKNPQLNFELIDVLVGINRLTLYYSNSAAHRRSVEIMRFNNNNKVDEVIVNYSE